MEDGAEWITEDNQRRIEEYVASGRTQKERVDLEVLATVAIAGVQLFVTVDYKLLRKSHITELVQRKDGIWMYRPSDILMLLDASPGESEEE